MQGGTPPPTVQQSAMLLLVVRSLSPANLPSPDALCRYSPASVLLLRYVVALSPGGHVAHNTRWAPTTPCG